MKALLLKFSGGLLVAAIVCTVLTTTAQAATYTVLNTDDTGAGSLRQAMTDAEATPGVADTIDFAIPGVGPHTITPATQLPILRDTVIIDGSTQTGSSCGTLVPSLPASSNTPHTLQIIIDGSLSGTIFDFSGGNGGEDASGSVIKGFNIVNVAGYAGAIAVRPSSGAIADNVQINCNYIGTDITGTVSQSNEVGVYLYNTSGTVVTNNLLSGNNTATSINANATLHHNLVGTTASGLTALANSDNAGSFGGLAVVASNIISGNANGLYIFDTATVQSNYIGLNLAGSAAIGNANYGIRVERASNVLIGGLSSAQRNMVSGNGTNGIEAVAVTGGGDGCSDGYISNLTVSGNYIGTNLAGDMSSGFGNGSNGVMVHAYNPESCQASIDKVTIGYSGTSIPNTIVGNGADGIRIYSSDGGPEQYVGSSVQNVSTVANTIYGNAGLGINLATDGENNGTANTDLGPNVINSYLMTYTSDYANYYLNKPVINSTSYLGNQITVDYSFQAPGVTENLPSISPTNIVGYRLDFYINSGAQDGAYAGYSQGKTHLGSFIVDGSEANATHTFTSPVTLGANQNITVTSTVLWQVIPNPGTNCLGDIFGDGPPYTTQCEN